MRQNKQIRSTLVVRLAVLVLCLTMFTGSVSANIAAKFMKDSVATFYDAATLIYYSFRSNEKKKPESAAAEAEKVRPENIKKFLRAKGLDISFDSKPITREHFAKTLMKRFKLKTSFSTSLFGWRSLYFSDAQKLGIFQKDESGSQAMSTKGMLRAFFKAKNISHK